MFKYTVLSIRNLKHRMENLSQWAMYKDGIVKLHIEGFIKELSEIEDNATNEITTLRAQLAEAREIISGVAEISPWSLAEADFLRQKAKAYLDKVTTA